MQVINCHKQVMPRKKISKSAQKSTQNPLKSTPKLHPKSTQKPPTPTTKKYARRVLFSKDLIIR